MKRHKCRWVIQTNRCRPTCRFEFNGSYPIVPSSHLQLEALRECRPPWPRQIITPILPTVKRLSLGGERLPPKNNNNNKVLIITCTTIWVCNPVFFFSFTHLRIPKSPPKFNQFVTVLPRTPP